MEEQINFKEELLKLRKELDKYKNENEDLKKIIQGQSNEIKNLKEDFIQNKKELLDEILNLKEAINSINLNLNKNIDNVPPLCTNFLTPMSSKTNNTLEKPEKGIYITSISFFISKAIDLSLSQLIYYGYEPVDGDIRKNAGGLFCILGCKYEKNKEFITNIIGSVSDKEEPVIIYENEIKYVAIKDPFNNSDIHNGSGGNFLTLYFTTDPKAGKPIKKLRNVSTKEILKDDNIVKYCSRKTKYNKPFEPLDCNRGRDNIIRNTPQNYIFIERD